MKGADSVGPELAAGWHSGDSTHVKAIQTGLIRPADRLHKPWDAPRALVIALSAGNDADISLAEELTECLPEDSTLIADKDPSRGRFFLEEVSLANVHVLVVDDEIDARNLVKRLLEIAGATVSMAASSSEAMERILASRPDPLVCDIGMPGEDGYSLIRAIEKIQESVLPAVALSAYARAADRNLI